MPIQLYCTCRSCEGNTGIAAENNRYEQEKDCDHVFGRSTGLEHKQFDRQQATNTG
jgi:hypothetical protein